MGELGLHSCGGTLLQRYDLKSIAPEELGRRGSLWRYAPMLPLEPGESTSLGEGWTPLREMRGGSTEGVRAYLKDEGVSPTGTFKARGMAVAVSVAAVEGRHKLVVPSAGNAGVALASYAAAADLKALVIAPSDTPPVLLREIIARGAECLLVRGDLREAGRYAALASEAGYHNLATLREPFRVEGKKTMGYEVWEQLGGAPDWVIFPTGGGTGVVGLWKAFQELGQLGWADGTMPRLCAVQSDGCQPLTKAWKEGGSHLPELQTVKTVAAGLRVPHPTAYRLILRIVRETGGVILSIPEDELVDAARRLGEHEGVSPCYEGAAAFLGYESLARDGRFTAGDRVVVFNTGMGLINPDTELPDLPVLDSPRDLLSRLDG